MGLPGSSQHRLCHPWASLLPTEGKDGLGRPRAAPHLRRAAMQPGTMPPALWAVGRLPRSSQGRVTEKEEKPAQSVLRDAICGKAHKAEMHAYKHTRVHAHVHTRTHTHMHTRVDACTHTEAQRESSGLTCTQRRMAVPLGRWGDKGTPVLAQSGFS